MNKVIKLKNWFGKLKVYSGISDNVILPNTVPHYPPFVKGFAPVSGEALLATHKELIGDIKERLALENYLYVPLIEKVIVRMANYAHFLPASEKEHHQASGGLLHHSLEVVRNILIETEEGKPFHNPMRGLDPETKIKSDLVWRVCLVYGGLLHDIGKITTYFKVNSDKGDYEWDPMRESLYAWCMRNNINKYMIHFKSNRFGKHEKECLPFFERIVGPNIRKFLNEEASGIYESCINSVCKIEESPLFDEIIREADMKSASDNTNKYNFIAQTDQATTPVEEYVKDAIDYYINSNKWEINIPGARVFVTDKGVFIPWTNAAKDICIYTKSKRYGGIPSQPNSLADTLVKRGLAEPMIMHGMERNIWVIEPSVLQYPNGKRVRLETLKLRNPEMYFPLGCLPTPIEATVSYVKGKDHAPVDQDNIKLAKKENATASGAKERSYETVDRAGFVEDLDELAASTESKVENEESSGLFDSVVEQDIDDPFAVNADESKENNLGNVDADKTDKAVERNDEQAESTEIQINAISDSDDPFASVDIEEHDIASNKFVGADSEGEAEKVKLLKDSILSEELFNELVSKESKVVFEIENHFYVDLDKAFGDRYKEAGKAALEKGDATSYEGSVNRYIYIVGEDIKAIQLTDRVSEALKQTGLLGKLLTRKEKEIYELDEDKEKEIEEKAPSKQTAEQAEGPVGLWMGNNSKKLLERLNVGSSEAEITSDIGLSIELRIKKIIKLYKKELLDRDGGYVVDGADLLYRVNGQQGPKIKKIELFENLQPIAEVIAVKNKQDVYGYNLKKYVDEHEAGLA